MSTGCENAASDDAQIRVEVDDASGSVPPIRTQNPTNLGEILLSRAKAFNTESPLPFDYIRLECVRQADVARAAPRCVLEAASDFFVHALAREPKPLDDQPADEDSRNTLRIDVSEEVIDIVLESLYTKSRIEITVRLVVPLFAASKQLALTELAQQVVEFVQENIHSCVEDHEFLSGDHLPADVATLGELFDSLALDIDAKYKLMQLVSRWSAEDSTKSDVASKLNAKLLSMRNSAVPKVGPPPKPVMSNLGTSFLIVWSNGAEWKGSTIRDGSLVTIWNPKNKLGQLDWHLKDSIVYRDELYSPNGKGMNVHCFESGALRRSTKMCEHHIHRMQIFADEVFLTIGNEVHVFGSQGLSMRRIARLDDHSHDFVVLSKGVDEVTIAVSDFLSSGVWSLTFRKGHLVESKQIVKYAPEGMALLGAHGGLLYFATARYYPLRYAAFANGAKVKEVKVSRSHCTVVDTYLCDGILHLIEWDTRDSSRKLCVKGLDLNTDQIIFLYPFGPCYNSQFLPVLREI